MKLHRLRPVVSQDIYFCLKELQSLTFYMRTPNTLSKVDRLMKSCDSRGRIKWSAESLDMRIQSIYSADSFPRYYYYLDSFSKEFDEWCVVRNESVIEIYIPEDILTVSQSVLVNTYFSSIETETRLIKIRGPLGNHLRESEVKKEATPIRNCA